MSKMNNANNMSVVFNQLANNLSHLRPICNSDKILIRNILQELNALDYSYSIVHNHTRAVLLINQLCALIPTDDVVLVVESCQLINKLITLQKVQVEGRTLPIAVEWLIKAIEGTIRNHNDCILHALVALDALLRRCSVPSKKELVHKITGIMELFHSNKDIIVQIAVAQCMEAITGSVDEPCENCHDVCNEVVNAVIDQIGSSVSSFATGKQKLEFCKLLIVTLRTLRNCITSCEHVLVTHLHQLMGVCKSLMVYKLKGIEFLPIGKCRPSLLSIPECTSSPQAVDGGSRGGGQRQRRRQRPVGKKLTVRDDDNKQESLLATPLDVSAEMSAESGTSDVENEKLNMFRVEAKVRQETLQLLLLITKSVDKSTLYSYLTVFLPADMTSMHAGHYVTNCVLKDSSTRGRMAALNVLLNMLVTGKPLLSHAEEDNRPVASFTPLSMVVSGVVRELHRCLCLALNETSFPVLTQVLKCLAALVQATPYHRLRPGLPAKIIRNVKLFIGHKDSTVQVAALIVLGCLLAATPALKETTIAFTRNVAAKKIALIDSDRSEVLDYANFSSDEEEQREAATCSVPWLIDKCVGNLLALPSVAPVPAPVKLESLQVLAVMCGEHHFTALVLPYLPQVTKALEAALLNSKYIDVRLHAGKTTEQLGEAMHTHYHLAGDSSLTFWQTLLDVEHGGPLLSLLQSELCILRAVGCDCLGSIGYRTFELLPKHLQLVCMTTLLSLSRDDEDNGVKGSAVRAIAILLLYPLVRADAGFVMDAADAIGRTMADVNVGVRIKASWSLGNLSDALVLNRKQQDDDEALPEGYLIALIKAAVVGSADNEKVKSNSVRALGNLMQLLSCSGGGEIIEESVAALLKCAASGIMKVRWNACYALGNVLKMPLLYRNDWKSCNLPAVIFKELVDSVVKSKNLKVRINAALALSSCSKREHYAECWLPVWGALISALENAENLTTDFNEYKHLDHLTEQICTTVAHMTVLLAADELLPLRDMVVGCESMLYTQMRRVYDRLVPEKSTILFAAKEHLNAGFDKRTLNENQLHVLNTLQHIFDVV